MVRFWSTLLTMVLACLVMVNVGYAQGQKKTKRTPEERKTALEKRFDDLEKKLKHDPLKGELSKDEFLKAVKETSPKMADRAEETFKNMKKADENKITKDEYVKAMTETAQRGQRGGGKKKGGG